MTIRTPHPTVAGFDADQPDDVQAAVNTLIWALVAARHRAGLTQQGVAERVHCSQRAIAHVEGRAVKVASLPMLGRYARAVGLRLTCELRLEPADTQ